MSLKSTKLHRVAAGDGRRAGPGFTLSDPPTTADVTALGVTGGHDGRVERGEHRVGAISGPGQKVVRFALDS